MILAAEEYWPHKAADAADKTTELRLRLSAAQFVRPLNVLLRPELLSHAVGAHVAHDAKYFPIKPGSIVLAKTPENPGVRIRIATIKRLLVV